MAPGQGQEPTSGAAPARVQRERRHLTILFCDLCESTRISSLLEAEEYDELLGVLRGIFSDAVARHGGEIVRIDGDGVAAIFGYPTAHEDDGRRAVEAAIDIHAAARRLGAETPGATAGIRLHSGIHAGLVLVKAGDLVRGRFEMLGDATNIARRLSDLAGADEIVVSEVSLGSDQNFFNVGETRLATIRGMAEPVAVLRVYGRQDVENRFVARSRRGLTPFTGRREELQRLDRLLRDVTAGGNRRAVLVGGAGLGKTRLASEFLGRAHSEGLAIHLGYCEAYLGAEPLQPFLQVRRSILASQPDAVDQGSAETDPVQALVDLIDRQTRSGPVILFIDDWQWADDASRRVLDNLDIVSNRGLLVILASRSFDGIDQQLNAAEVISLVPLPRVDCEAAIGSLLYAAEPFLVERIVEGAGGNPLLIEELCHTQRPGFPGRGGAGGAWLEMLVESRFAQLSASRAAVVKAAAVIGHMIPTWLFEAVTGLSAEGDEVAALAADDFIYSSPIPGMLQFKHGITRDAVYELIDLEERRASHRSVVDALRRHSQATAQNEPLEMLAYHLVGAGRAREAADYAERAGDVAMAASSLDRAQAQYRAALAALESLPPSAGADERWDIIARKFAEASVFDPSREQLPILQRARERAVKSGIRRDMALADYWLGCLHYGLGECRQSIHHCRRALLASSAVSDDKLSVEIRATLGQAHATACEHSPALELLSDAIEIKKRYRSGRRLAVGLVYSISCRAFVLADQGRFEEAYAGFDEAIDALGGSVHRVAASIMTQRSASCLWHGRMEDARLYAAEAERVAAQVKARYLFSMARALGAYGRWSQDRSPEAMAAIIEATAWLEASESQQFISLNHGWLTEALASVGDMSGARRHAARALRRARQGDRLGEAMALRALARAAANGHGHRSASHYLTYAEASAEARQSAHEKAKNRLCTAEVAGTAEDIRAAKSGLTALGLDWFARGSRRWPIAVTLARTTAAE